MPDHNGNNPASTTENTINPNRDVLQDMLPATTLGGKQRQRMRWSDEINRHLIFCYYQTTNLETNKTEYRSQLHTAFTNRYPELNFLTEQRLADQVRVIIKNNRIPQPELEHIKQQVQQLLQQSQEQNNAQTEEEANIHYIEQTNEETETEPHNQPQGNENIEQQEEQRQSQQQESVHTDVDEKFELTYIEYQDINTDGRPYIQKLPDKPQTKTTIAHVNTIIRNKINNNTTMEELQLLIYTGALTTTRIHTKQKEETSMNSKTKTTTPAWQHRLEKKIEKLRKSIGQLTQFTQHKLSDKRQEALGNISKQEAIEQLEEKKQKLQALAKRLRRYKKSENRRRQNQTFNTNQKKFYQTLDGTKNHN